MIHALIVKYSLFMRSTGWFAGQFFSMRACGPAAGRSRSADLEIESQRTFSL